MSNVLSNNDKTLAISETSNAVYNLEKVYKKIMCKLKEASKNQNTSEIKHGKLADSFNNSPMNHKAVACTVQDGLKKNISRKKPQCAKQKRKRGKLLPKSNATQPYQLRKVPETTGFKKVFGFGSFIRIPDKPKEKISQPYWRPNWKTRLMLSSLMKEYSQLSVPGSVQSKRSVTVSRKSSLGQRPVSYKAMDEVTALSYIQNKPKLFVPCRSASRSFNLKLNLQSVASAKKLHKTESLEVPREIKECPAKQKSCSELVLNKDDIWAGPCVPARCTCYPGNHEKLLPLPLPLKSFRSQQNVYLDTFVETLKKDWKSMSSEVGLVLKTQFSNKTEQKSHLQVFLQQLKKREQQLGEVDGVVKEVKKMKERLISLETKSLTQRNTDGLKLALKRIHSAL